MNTRIARFVTLRNGLRRDVLDDTWTTPRFDNQVERRAQRAARTHTSGCMMVGYDQRIG